MAGDCSRAEDSGRPSSASSGGWGTSWGGQDEDFHCQTDENGIIGLNRWATEEAELEVGGAEEGTGDTTSRLDPLQDQSFHLSELRDSPSPGSHALSLFDLDEQASDSHVSEEGEGSWHVRRQPERDKQCDMTEDEEEEEGRFSDSFIWGAVDPRDRLCRTETPESGRAEDRDASCSLDPRRVLAQSPGRVEVEVEDVGVEGRAEEPSCSLPPSPLPRAPKMMHHESDTLPSSAVQRSRMVCQSPANHTPCSRAPKGLRTSTGESQKGGYSQDHNRLGKGQLNHPLPDFSKVEPRVHFPKGGYKPPKSKGCPRKKNATSEKPLVFKSPADIVREVLLSGPDSPPLSPAGPLRALNATVPREFRSPRQASELVRQLQEDYNRLLTKYAEAENTIDRLRLAAKVNLYSDPPKPSHPDYTGTLSMGSKVMTMTLPWAQRAQLDPIAVSTGTDPAKQERAAERGSSPTVPSASTLTSASSLGPRFGECVTEALSRQAERLQMQVDSFEELLRARKLTPFEHVLKGLSCLAEGQGSLERGYLRAREEHRLQQQLVGDPGPFDPHRELEGRIFLMGMRLEKLKEQVQPGAQVPPTTPPLTALRPGLTADLSTASTPHPLPESQPSPTVGGARVLMGLPVSWVREESENEGEDEDEGEEEADERGPSPLPWARQHGHEHGENDLSQLPQQVPEGTREGTLDPSLGCSQREPLPLCPTFLWQQSQDARWGGAKSRSGSSMSAGESVASEAPASRPQSALRRAPAQDGIMSPETDSGFVGSESSRLNLGVPSPAQQEAAASQCSPLERGGEKMLPFSTRPHLGSACQELTSPECSKAVASDPEVLPSGEKSRLAPPSTPRRWPGSSTSEFESESDRPHSSSEDEEENQSVCDTKPTNQRPHHPSRPSLTNVYCHGNPFRVQGNGQPEDRHKALQSLQAEMSRLREQLENSLRTGKSLYPLTAPPLVQEASLHSTLHPRVSECQENERREEGGEQEEEGEMEEEEMEGRDEDERSSPVPCLRPELNATTGSQHSPTTSKPHAYNRPIPESSGVQRRRQRRWKRGEERTEPVEHRWPHMGPLYSRAASGGPHVVNQRRSYSRSNHTPNDITRNPTRVESAGGQANARHTPPHAGYCTSHHGSSRCREGTDTAGRSMHRDSDSAHQNGWPLGVTHRTDGCVFLTAPPSPVLGSVPLVQYVPVYPSVLYCSTPASEAPPPHRQPLLLLPDWGGQGSRRHSCDVPADRAPLGDSLTRAIEAARRMRAASRRMARSLSASVGHQGALSLP